jgi:phosphoribosylamine--glycine ligase
MASDGYPEAYKKGFEITIDPAVAETVYVAGASLSEGKLLTGGGRVLGVTATADTLTDAIDAAYARVERVSFEGAFFRHDIGARAKKALEENL